MPSVAEMGNFMAQNVGQTAAPPMLEEELCTRCSEKRPGEPGRALDTWTELAKRAKQAAAKYFLKVGTDDKVLIPDLEH